MTATIWRTCPSCGAGFEQPDDPGRKRVYCSRACQQAAYRARQRTSAGQHSGRQDRRSDHHHPGRERAGSDRPGAGQGQDRRQERQDEQRQQRRPPPHSANGQRPGAASGDDLARIRRIIAALLRKAAATSFPTRPPLAGRKPRPCGPSTASSAAQPIVTSRLASRRAGRIVRIVTAAGRRKRNGSSRTRPSVSHGSSRRPAP